MLLIFKILSPFKVKPHKQQNVNFSFNIWGNNKLTAKVSCTI